MTMKPVSEIKNSFVRRALIIPVLIPIAIAYMFIVFAMIRQAVRAAGVTGSHLHKAYMSGLIVDVWRGQ